MVSQSLCKKKPESRRAFLEAEFIASCICFVEGCVVSTRVSFSSDRNRKRTGATPRTILIVGTSFAASTRYRFTLVNGCRRQPLCSLARLPWGDGKRLSLKASRDLERACLGRVWGCELLSRRAHGRYAWRGRAHQKEPPRGTNRTSSSNLQEAMERDRCRATCPNPCGRTVRECRGKAKPGGATTDHGPGAAPLPRPRPPSPTDAVREFLPAWPCRATGQDPP